MKLCRALIAVALVVGTLGLTPTIAGAAPTVSSVSPSGGVNTGPSQVTVNGTGFVPGSKVTLVEVNQVTGAVETTVTSTGGTVSADGTQISGVTIPTTGLPPRNPTNTPPGTSANVTWKVRVTNPDATTSTSGEFALIGDQPALNSVSPSSVTQGEAKTLTLGGQNFAQRASITIAQATHPDADEPGYVSGDPISISEVTWKSLGQYTIKVTVPSDYPTGSRDITLKNTDGKTTTCTGCLTVAPKTATNVPTVGSISPEFESNADSKSSVSVTIKGTKFNDAGNIQAALVGYCPSAQPSCAMAGRVINLTEISVTDGGTNPLADDTLSGKVDLVAESPGKYSVRVNNTGSGKSGSATKENAFEVLATPPGISSPTKSFPQVIKAGETETFIVTGSNFAKGDSVSIPDTTVTQVELVSRSRLKVTARADADAETSPQDLTVRHTNGAAATCDDCVLLRASTPKVDKYIDAVHRLFLGRGATSNDLSRWRPTVNSGNREALTRDLANSDEFAGVQIDLLYREILGRASDRPGRLYWLDQVKRGLRLDEIASYFYGGTEYFKRHDSSNTKFVEALYRDILGRNAEKSGRDYWVDQIKEHKVPRSEIAAGFYASIESRRGRVVQQYLLVLGRHPDTSGREYWAEQIKTLGDIVLASFLASSDEYYTRATRS